MLKLIYFPFTIRTAPQCQAPSPQDITLCHQVFQLSHRVTVAALLRDVSRCIAAACSAPRHLHCLDKRSSHHSLLGLQTYAWGQGKIHTAGGKGGRKTTQASICSSPPVPCPQKRTKRYVHTQITNILSFKYNTQLKILFRLLSSEGLWHCHSSPFQHNTAVLTSIQNAMQRLLGFGNVTLFYTTFH